MLPPNSGLNITKFSKSGQWVSDALKDEISSWTHRDAVFISAQTGSGKNHFIAEYLIPYALEHRQQVFIFSNRSLLNIQQKKDILRKLSFPNIWSDEDLENIMTFGSVYIVTYQNALRFLYQYGYNAPIGVIPPNLSTGFAIFDEAHFFLSDATFNAETEQIYQRLLYAFSGYVRIYMTATPEHILPLVSRYEMDCKENERYTYCDLIYRTKFLEGKSMKIYEFARDYSGYDVKFYNDISELYEKMSEANHNNKWLCFINDKDKQSAIKRDLKAKCSIEIDCFDRTKKGIGKLWGSLINGILLHDILFTTIALDNGISINDSGLHNIVVDSVDQVSLLQMIGRKRRERDEKIQLFIHVSSIDEVKKQLLSIRDMQAFIIEYRSNPNFFLQQRWSEFHSRYRNLFSISQDQKLVLNSFAEIELSYLFNFYSSLLFDMQESKNDIERREVYPRCVIKWLELEQDIQWVDNRQIAITELRGLLEKYLPTGVSAEKDGEKDSFIDLFYRCANKISPKRFSQKNRLGPTDMNKFLEEYKTVLGALYKVEGKPNWRIIKE